MIFGLQGMVKGLKWGGDEGPQGGGKLQEGKFNEGVDSFMLSSGARSDHKAPSLLSLTSHAACHPVLYSTLSIKAIPPPKPWTPPKLSVFTQSLKMEHDAKRHLDCILHTEEPRGRNHDGKRQAPLKWGRKDMTSHTHLLSFSTAIPSTCCLYL